MRAILVSLRRLVSTFSARHLPDNLRKGGLCRLCLILTLFTAVICLTTGRSLAAEQSVTYQINPAHTGFLTMPGFYPPLAKRWSIDLGRTVSYPLIADGRVFVTVGDGGSSEKWLYALEATTGAVLWRVPITSPHYRNCIAYENGLVFLVNFGAVTAYAADSGTVRWRTEMTNKPLMSIPTVRDGVLYVGVAVRDVNPGSTLAAINAENGGVLWMRDLMAAPMFSPTVTPSGIYIPYGLGGIGKFDPISGDLLASKSTANTSSLNLPVVMNGYVSLRGTGGEEGYLHDSGTLDFIRNIPHRFPPAFDNDRGYFVRLRSIEARDANDEIVWSQSIPAVNYHVAPIVINSVVYVGTQFGIIQAYDAVMGTDLWSDSAGSAMRVAEEASAQAVLNGLGAGEGLLVAPAGSTLSAYEPAPSPAVLAAISLDDSTLRGGSAGSGRVQLTRPAPAGGLTISLFSNHAAVKVPNIVTVVEGSDSATFAFTTTYISSPVNVALTASLSGTDKIVRLSLLRPTTSPPTNVTARAGNNTVTISWDGNPSASGYLLGRSESPGGPYTFISLPVNQALYTDAAVQNDIAYYYVVAAKAYGGESARSAEVTATPRGSLTPAPTNLTATGGYGQIKLTWTTPSQRIYVYSIKRATVPGGPYVSIGAWQGPGDYYIDQGNYQNGSLVPGTTYYYVVSARGADGESGNSNEASAACMPTPPTLPAPVNLTATVGEDKIALSWTPAPGTPATASYRVKRATASNSVFQTIATLNPSGTEPAATTFDDTPTGNTPLSYGTTYYYIVTAAHVYTEPYPQTFDSLRSNEVSAILYRGTVATPVISPNGGLVPTTVTLSCATPGATIHYTTDGSTPTASSPVYATPGTLREPATVKAFARSTGYRDSAVTSASFTAPPPVAQAPTISPNGGEYNSPVAVTLSTATPGASIYYTLDGSTPTTTPSTSVFLYTAPFTLKKSTTVNALTVADGYKASAVSSARFTVTMPNQPPSIRITAPQTGSVFAPPVTFLIETEVTDDSAVERVRFYNGNVGIGEDTTPPYTLNCTNVPAGTYRLTAQAIDDQGAVGVSEVVTVIVNVPPTVVLTSPVNNAVFAAPANITLNANAEDRDGMVRRVEFYEGDNKLGEDTTAPYSFVWTGVPSGTYRLTAVAWDSNGVSTKSAVATVTVNGPPTVQLTAPANGAVYPSPASIALQATASDADGTVAKVEFYRGTYRIGEDTSAPYAFTWNNVAAGTYALTARAIDNRGAVATSETVTVSVNNPPTVALTAPYNNTIVAAGGSITVSANAADSGGQIAKVEFFANGNKIGEDATSPYSIVWTNAAPGVYSLTAVATDNLGTSKTSTPVTLTVNAPPTVALTAPSDGAVVAAPATITFEATASNTGGSVARVEFYQGGTRIGQDTTAPYAFTWSNVAAGVYTLTARAFDNNGASAVSAPVRITVNNPPTVTLTAPANNATVAAGTNVTVSANAADIGGLVAKVEFFVDGSKIGEDATAPYAIVWTNVPAGRHVLTAVATDNVGATKTSAAVTVVAGTTPAGPTPPTVRMVAPADGATFKAPATFVIEAQASDADGPISRVEFYNGGTKIGEAATVPYRLTVGYVPVGTYVLSARARDAQGAVASSGTVTVTVTR